MAMLMKNAFECGYLVHSNTLEAIMCRPWLKASGDSLPIVPRVFPIILAPTIPKAIEAAVTSTRML